jgi:CheY-like chemotaxis protein
MPKVLVVEDERSVVTIVRYHLESAGFQSFFADNVDEGRRLLVGESPDVAVVDIRLPGSDGWALIEWLRRDGRYHDLPVIVLTGLLEPEVVERASSLGCEYLSKPFAATALLSKIRILLAASGRGDGAAARTGVDPKTNLVALGVVLLLEDYQVDGIVYLPPELARFSDAWESLMRDQRSFFPVTNATIYPSTGGHAVASPAFMEVRKNDVRAVFPKDVQPD